MTTRVYWHTPPTILAARVADWNAGNKGYPITSIDVNNFSIGGSSLSGVRNGQTLLMGTSAGRSDLGRGIVRSTQLAGAGFNPTISVGWAEQGNHDGEFNISIGAYITVLQEYRLWAKIPNIAIQPNDVDNNPVPPIIYMNGDVRAGTFPINPVPVSNVGAHVAGTKNPATGGFDVTYDVNNSFQFDLSHGFGAISNGKIIWEFGGGTILSGSTSSRQATVRYTPGVYVAHLTVSSDANVAHVSHKLIFVRDPANDLTLKHQIVSHTATPKGQEISIKVFQPMDPDVYRDGAMVLIWEDEDDFPPYNQARMIFAGWHLSEESGFEHERTGSYGDTTFRLIDINGKLEQTPGFSQEMNYNGPGMPLAVGEWNQTPYNNVLFFLCFILYWQSTALSVADLLVDNYLLPLLKFLRLTCDADTLYAQVNKLANMMIPDFYLTCLRTGEMRLSVDVSLMYDTDRQNFAPTMGILASPNWTSVSIEARRFPRVYEQMSGAIASSSLYEYDTATPPNLIVKTFWCIAPGKTGRGQGAVAQQSTNHLVDDQFTLNYVEGNRYARLNSPWGDIRVKAPWDSNQFGAMDPGMMGRVVLSLTVFDNENPPKPWPLYDLMTMIKEINWSYDYQKDGETRDVEFTLEAETVGPPAVKIDKPPGISIT